MGSWMAARAKLPASAVGIVKSTNKSLLKILKTDDQLLEAVQVGFLAMIRDLRENNRRLEVTCFFEELPLPVVGKLCPRGWSHSPATILLAFMPIMATWPGLPLQKRMVSRECLGSFLGGKWGYGSQRGTGLALRLQLSRVGNFTPMEMGLLHAGI